MDSFFWLRRAREWRVPAANTQGRAMLLTEEGLPLMVETSEHELMTENA